MLLDGLVASAVPEVIAPERDRLRLVTLVHLPLGHEWGAGAPDGQDAARCEREREVLAAATTLITTSRWTLRMEIREEIGDWRLRDRET